MTHYFLPLLIGFCLFFSISLSAQKIHLSRNSYAVNINNMDETVKAFVLSETRKIKVKDNLIYFWTSSNTIMQTSGGYDGKLLHGHYVSCFLNNNLKEEGEFYRGVKSGKWKAWYPNGKIKEIENWKNGLRNGPCKSYNEAEELLVENNFRKGKLNVTRRFIKNAKN